MTTWRHRANYRQMWRHAQNWKYITYRKAAWRRSSGHMWHAQKFGKVWISGFKLSPRTDRQTDRTTHRPTYTLITILRLYRKLLVAGQPSAVTEYRLQTNYSMSVFTQFPFCFRQMTNDYNHSGHFLFIFKMSLAFIFYLPVGQTCFRHQKHICLIINNITSKVFGNIHT